MFGKRDAMDDLEAGKLASLKHYLSRELSTSIKKLQRDHISSDSAIRSGETANKICNLIEAVFLHHLKESYSIKTPWPFLVKFTHKDVVSQLKGLTQVNTEVGYCRAWVRLALNDGLIDSYMDAMLSDVKVIQSHYKRTSFLRDTEEPHIMKNYLQGLVNFTFQLSFNSSLLNVWGAAPMILAGSWQTTRERTQSNPNNTRKVITGGPPLGIHQPGRPTTQDLITRNDDLRACSQRSPSFEESFHECEISSALLRSPSEDGAALMRMGGPAADAPYPDAGATTENRGDLFSPEEGDLSRIRQDSFEDSVVIHMVSDGSAESLAEEEPVETVYQSTEESKTNEFDANTDEEEDEQRRDQPSEPSQADIPAPNPFDARERDVNLPQTDAFLSNNINPDTPPEPLQGSGLRETQERAVDQQPPIRDIRSSEGQSQSKEDLHTVYGNSLGAMSGWSSEFQNQLSPETPSKDTVPHMISYNTLLETYSLQGPQPPTSFPDALDQPPDHRITTSMVGTETSYVHKLSDPDDIPSDFERTQSLLATVTEIGREKGLDNQTYQCKGCSRPVGIIYGKARVCNYNGGYYCYDCHKDDEAIIPARILHNWDFRKHKVAVHTKLFLQQIEEMPLLDVEDCNQSLYKASPELNNVLKVRMQLKYLKAYLFTCKQSVAEELRKKIWPREYMLDHAHLYSVQDFLQVQSGVLMHTLRKVIVFAAKHVQQCALCSQKGFICLICESPKIIYPFDTELTVRCDSCKTVFHKACKSDTTPCPKCERRLLRKQQLRPSPEDLDFASPFT